MKRRLFCIVSFVALNVSVCFAHHMAVVVNKNNTVTTVTSTHLAKMFRSDTKKWTDGQDVILVLHKTSKGEMLTLQKLTTMPENDLKSRLHDRTEGVILVDSDDDVLNAVESHPSAIGLVEVRSINNKVKVIKVDGKLPLEHGYLPD
jgi:ABC-type phosphate transport system substrate-binding protein